MFLGRVLFFRLHESPKFLVASNRPSAAVIALRRISKINGDDKRWVLSDVVDTDGAAEVIAQEELDERTKEAQLADASRPGSDELSPRELQAFDERDRDRVPSPSDLDDEEEADLSVFELPPSVVSHSPPAHRKDRPAWIERLPAGWQDSADEYLARLDDLLEPRWKRTTLLVWTVWTLASAGYTVRLNCHMCVSPTTQTHDDRTPPDLQRLPPQVPRSQAFVRRLDCSCRVNARRDVARLCVSTHVPRQRMRG